MQLDFLAIFIYAYNLKEKMKELLEYLNQVLVAMLKPWIVLGDFNFVLHIEDRQGGNLVTISEVIDFQERLDLNRLVELPNGSSLIHGMTNRKMAGYFLELIGYL